MFGYGRGHRGGYHGRGRGLGRGGGRGFGRGYGPGRGACFAYYQETGEWPAWSRWAGGPGAGRFQATQDWASQPQPETQMSGMEDLTALRSEVAAIRREVDEALSRLSEMNA
ncbi:MAG: hypothetical protein ACLFTI_08800 [Anaerolineales bacterium]